MKIYQILVLATLTVLVSCKKDVDNTSEPVMADTTATVIDSVKPADIKVTGRYDLKQLIDPFIAEKQKLEQQLSSAPPEEANKLYDSYIEANRERIAKISEKEHNLLENFYSYFYDDMNEINPPDSIRLKVKLLKSAGLELCEEGEGYVNICTNYMFYYNMFKNYVTNDYKDYIALEAKDNEKLWVADAGIGISWKELGEKVISWDNFVKKYPKSHLSAKAKDTLRSYQYFYLFGLDNTRAHDDSDKYLDENIVEYKRFISLYPNSFTAKLTKTALEYTGSSENLNKIITTEQEKYFH